MPMSETAGLGQPIIEMRDVNKWYGDFHVLKDVTLTVRRGEKVVVIGPSGSGKSSLLAVAGALTRPTAGTVRIGGVDLAGLDARALTRLRRDRIGYVFQSANLMPSLTAREQLLLPMHVAGRLDGAARRRADELLEAVGMAHRADRRPHQLSGGERQRTGLARALMSRPALLLVDEPTSALDRERAREVVALLAEQSHVRATATVMVTHDSSVLDLVDRARQLRDGRFLPEGDMALSL